LKTLSEGATSQADRIKAAVRAGATVHEGQPGSGYVVRRHVFKSGEEQWLITFAPTGWCIGLTHADGQTLNGKRFFNGEVEM
jgi:hypothetical protein